MESSDLQTQESKDSVSPPIPQCLHNLPPNATTSASSSSSATTLTFPPGFRFRPHNHELIIHYLYNKVHSLALPPNNIIEVNLYDHNPETLAERFRRCGEKDLYFFTPRNKKYKNGSRPNRAAGDGYWKATGADMKVWFNGEVVGYKKALVFYLGRPPNKGDKTKWLMHEFRMKDPPTPVTRDNNDMMLDEWVLCKIYKKAEKANVRAQPVEEQASMMMMRHDYPSFDNYMQHQFPFSEHLNEPHNFSMFNLDKPQPPSGASGPSSSQANYAIFDNNDPMAEPIYAPHLNMHHPDHHYLASPLDSLFPDIDWSVLDYQHGHDADSWIDHRFQNNNTTIYPADIKNSPNHPAS